ncbi:MAG: glutamate racemase [Bacteroidales bacterium]|nr:glutamate racemase [Bacteroidales bacterium]
MIGIFDSGVGGLSVFREIRKLLPEERYVYFSDNAHCPYGEKSKEYIIGRARTITDFMLQEGADIIVVACNTATAAAIKTLRTEYPISFIGMEPAVKPAAAITRTGVIGVLATAGTLKADKYLSTKGLHAEDVTVVEHIGQGFVELVENGITTGPKAEAIIMESLEPLLDAGADTIVLGCTHYPFLKDTIVKVAASLTPGRNVTVIDPAPAVAKHLHEVMEHANIIKREGYSLSLHASGDDSLLRNMVSNL